MNNCCVLEMVKLILNSRLKRYLTYQFLKKLVVNRDHSFKYIVQCPLNSIGPIHDT